MATEERTGIVRSFLYNRFRPFVEITRKYKTPRIKTTRMVRVALLLLRIYLVAMVGLLIMKFFMSV